MKHKRLLKGIICGALAASLISMGMLPVCQPAAVYAAESKVLTGTYQNVVESFDWGPGVTKILVHLDSDISGDAEGNLDKDAFQVETSKAGYGENNAKVTTTEKREITGVYTCDDKGVKSAGPSSYIAIEMSVSPSSGSPFYYDLSVSLNDWSSPYEQKITVTKDITSGTDTITGLTLTEAENPRILVQAGVFKHDTYTYGSGDAAKTLHYAYYEAESASDKKGLVIWLHGSGEGGQNAEIALLGNKTANLAGKEIQDALTGADVLVAQCPSRWLTYQTGLNKDDVNTQDKYQSEYTETLKNLIDSYVSAHPGVDADRIYIGGASNGGSMTMNMILNYPDYFAAAYFASEGYADRYITDEQIGTIKDIPMWFVYAEGDTTNEASKTTKATYDRLAAAGAKDVRLSYYADGVVDKTGKYKDEDGTPHKYSSHWSWIYLLNNDCTDNGTTLMSWLGAQKKDSASNEPSPSEPSQEPSPSEPSSDASEAPSKVALVKAAAKGDGRIEVSWAEKTDVRGYIIYVSENMNFETSDRIIAGRPDKNRIIISDCTEGQEYFIHVRAYTRSESGETVYGAYSKTVRVTAE